MSPEILRDLCALCASVAKKSLCADQGVPPPPPVYILYLYGHPKRGQNEGIFPAFVDQSRANASNHRDQVIHKFMSFADRSIMKPCEHNCRP